MNGGNPLSEQPTPIDPDQEAQTTELLRVWFVNQEMECTLSPVAFDDPADWGMVLADLARYVARGLEEMEGKDYQKTLELIADTFHKEIANPPEP